MTTKISKTAKFHKARPPQVIIKGANFEDQLPQLESVQTGNEFHSESDTLTPESPETENMITDSDHIWWMFEKTWLE